jgi:hypothetical protein
MNRRGFLTACGVMAGMLVPAGSILSGCTVGRPTRPRGRAPGAGPAGRARQAKVIIVVFGGGTRYSESIGDPEHRYVPKLWNELVPRGALFTNVRVEGRVVHPNCTASIVTGHREYDADNDWCRPVEHPTVFEVLRKARAAPDTAVWGFVYASILSNVGHSRAAGYGLEYAANVVEPPTIPRETAERIGNLLREASAAGSLEREMAAARQAAQWARTDSHLSRSGLRSESALTFIEQQYQAWKSGSGTTSHDAFLADGAVACMERFAPEVLLVAFGEIDCAHYGSWSRYVEAIQRTDELTCRLWRAAEKLEGYRDNTLMVILPDHGRELERPGGMGYVHHSDFYTHENEDEGCRRVWMLVLGPGVTQGHKLDRRVPQIAAAATALEHLGVTPAPGAAPSLLAAA